MVARHTKSEVHASIHMCIYHALVNRVVQVFVLALDSHIIGEESILCFCGKCQPIGQIDRWTGGLAGDMLINSHRFYGHDKIRH